MHILWVGNPQRLNVKRSVIKFSSPMGTSQRGPGGRRSYVCVLRKKTLAGRRYSPILYESIKILTLIELIWTITPAVILMLIAFPSFKLLYLMDEVSDPSMSVLAEGHQWYWSYQYPDFLDSSEEFIEFDSYIIPDSDLEEGKLRMLEVDNRVILPELTHVRFIITSGDVIHSYACPSLGIKCDAYPGRLNQVSVFINREGVFYGPTHTMAWTVVNL